MILAIDCANFSTSIALSHQNQILATFENTSSYYESATLISRIDRLFKESSQSLAHLEAIVVTIGPGSFTGIRLGIAAARGLSYALKIPLYAVNSFAWVAQSYKTHFGLSTNLLVALESKREEIFVALYSKDLICQQTPGFVKPEEIIDSLAQQNFQIIGDAALYFKNKISEVQPWMPNARDLAHYGHTYHSSDEKFDVCKPYYIRTPEIHGSL